MSAESLGRALRESCLKGSQTSSFWKFAVLKVALQHRPAARPAVCPTLAYPFSSIHEVEEIGTGLHWNAATLHAP